MVKYLVIFFIYLLSTPNVTGQKRLSQKNNDSISVCNQLHEFIESFENLDFDRFQTFFSTDVTVFFPPSAMINYRVEGKKNAMKVFKDFFVKVKQGKSNPPYLDISPKKLKMTLMQDVAIVTFELEKSDAISRRTIVFRKENGKFLIFHLHASKMENPK
jgi:hypothetical protein